MDQIGTSDIFSDLQVDVESKAILQTTTKWAKLTAIIGLVSIGLTLVTLISAFMAGFGANSGMWLNAFGGSAVLVMIFAIPILAIMIILNIYLLRFSTSTASGIQNFKQDVFNQGIKFLKYYFKIIGIVIIIVIGIFLIMLIAFGLGSAV